MAYVPRSYIPAAGHDWSLPFYDPIVKLLGGDAARRALVAQAELHSTDRVLEVGCGTGGLVMLIKRLHPRLEAVGLDPDARALARARRKADGASVSIQLDRGFSDALPYPDASFDRVFSCFMFHHLEKIEEKQRTLREVRRVLKPGGRLHLLDFAPPASRKERFLARWIHSSHLFKDNREDRVLSLMSDAGLDDPKTVSHGKMFFSLRTAYYQAAATRS